MRRTWRLVLLFPDIVERWDIVVLTRAHLKAKTAFFNENKALHEVLAENRSRSLLAG